MNKLLERKNVYKVPVPTETLEEWNKQKARGLAKYGSLFRDEEEFEFFWMLPLNEEQRLKLLRSLSDERRLQLEVEICTGGVDSSAAHRDLCIKCCVTNRPAIAVPFY